MHRCGWCLLPHCSPGSFAGQQPWHPACGGHGGGRLLDDGEPQQWLLPSGRGPLCPLCGEGGGYFRQPTVWLCALPLRHWSGFVADPVPDHHLRRTSSVAVLFQTMREGVDGAAMKRISESSKPAKATLEMDPCPSSSKLLIMAICSL